MPTYASTASFDLSIDEIAEEAYERCGLQVRSGYDLQTARRSLNLMLSEWANRGLNLWTIQLQEKTITGGVGSLSNKEHKCHGLSWSWAATHRCHKLTEENHDGGVYPVRRVRRRVALNPWVSPEVAFSDLVKWLAHERLENLLWRACDTL